MSGYPNVLKYFMWEWQVHFRISCQTQAESLFNQLDRGLQPDVFLLGFLKNDQRKDRLNICVEPENLESIVNYFSNVDDLAKKTFEADDRRNMFYTGPGQQELMTKRLINDTFRLTIEQILNDKLDADRLYFVSESVEIDDFDVYVILSLDKVVYNSHIHLEKDDTEDLVKKYLSFIEAIKDSFLKSLNQMLHLPEPGRNLSSDGKSSDELLRESAKKFMYTIASAGQNFEGLHGLFNACEKLSIQRYEGHENFGSLLIASDEHEQIELEIAVKDSFHTRNLRKLRKYMELSNESLSVISDSAEVKGLGWLKKTYNKDQTIFRIVFRGVHCWDVLHGTDVILQMRYGLPELPREIINKQKFLNDTKRTFTGISIEQSEMILQIAKAATSQKNGALIIISQNAREESERLKNQCIPLVPCKLDDDKVVMLSNIDGAIISDTNGVAYAHGVILDGKVGKKGDSSRGSRFNSALTYIESQGIANPTMAVVVSEDGMVDILPSLRPQIRHSDIKQVIEILKNLNSKESFDIKSYNNAMDWLYSNRFYLTQEECAVINDIKKNIEDLIRKSESMWIVREDLAPSEDMNSSYYL